ncbi:AAA family ATPase [Vagococcus salmoninarum]|uniref:AAA family ATPase n=1 Tax=Vagococcus salmoninarum TaxID=2739 RepID=UPI00187E1605|nr:AAA family ATPase [Vagococcus salmoninarum]MBE9390035.1 AAA family ATPase [Vagococcus salmoninarum]
MKTIKINWLKYRYFNNFEKQEIKLNASNAVISGKNDAGKTTLLDGFLWLINGKNQYNEKFNPKPLDKNNHERLGLEPEIEAELLIDGVPTLLKRVQAEKWTTPRGQLEKNRGNDTTKYYIDSVPKKEKEWSQFWEQVASDQLLFSLINLKYFMMMNWKERRQILISMTGLTDDEIIAKDPKLKELSAILSGKSIEDMKKILAGQKKEIAKQIEGVPGRIQENVDAIERLVLGDMTKESVTASLATYEKSVNHKQQQLNTVKNGQAELKYQEELSQIRLQLAEGKANFISKEKLATHSLQAEVNESQQIVNNFRKSVNEKESDHYRLEQRVSDKHRYRETLLSTYKELNRMVATTTAETFDDHQTVCPTCSQDLPKNKVDTLMAEFNVSKSEKLTQYMKQIDENKTTGQQTKADILSLEKEASATELAVQTVKSDLEKATQQLDAINNKLTNEKGKQASFETSELYLKLSQKEAQLQMKISNATSDNSQAIREATEVLNRETRSLDALKGALASFGQAEEFKARINELKTLDAELKSQNLDIQRQQFLIDEFIRRKVKLLEASINNNFSLVNFKLFDLQKNGGLNEVCEATVNGVEYHSGLNTSARVKADIDIINALSKHFGYSLPVVIDNAEGINKGNVPVTIGQRIELHVAEEPGLKVELN